MMNPVRKILAIAAVAFAAQAAAQVTVYEHEGFRGRSFTAQQTIPNMNQMGFNDLASSIEVVGERWEVCDSMRFRGNCIVLRPGRYPSLATLGLNDRMSSLRPIDRNERIDDSRYAPLPAIVAQITLYEYEGFRGATFTTEQAVTRLERFGFNDRASSVEVIGERWEVCEEVRFGGRCVVLRPGRYGSLNAMGLGDRASSVRLAGRNEPVPPAVLVAARVTFYEGEYFQGRSFTTGQPIHNLDRFGFNDRASSAEVVGERWEVCEDTSFRGRCIVLRPGRYASLAAMGLNNRASSARDVDANARIEDSRYGPPAHSGDYRRRDNERLYEANVTSVRAVVGTPEQRCWVEQEQVASQRSGANVPGAIIGGIVGGILGHQVGGGSGRDIATVGGAVAGAAVGAQVNRGTTQVASTRDVQRCETVTSQASPSYWDVTYSFRGQEHRMQMNVAPGRTVTVNEQGEPRG